jgi:hypothetical protein
MPDQQALILNQPGKGAFNYPALAVSPGFSSILDSRPFTIFTMWNDQINSYRLKLFAEWAAAEWAAAV